MIDRDTHIKDLPFASHRTRIVNALANERIETLGQLAEFWLMHGDSGIKKIPLMGRGCLAELKRLLELENS